MSAAAVPAVASVIALSAASVPVPMQISHNGDSDCDNDSESVRQPAGRDAAAAASEPLSVSRVSARGAHASSDALLAGLSARLTTSNGPTVHVVTTMDENDGQAFALVLAAEQVSLMVLVLQVHCCAWLPGIATI